MSCMYISYSCGRVLRNVEEAEFHAVKSGHSNFSESTEEKKALTKEEKEAQLKKLVYRMINILLDVGLSTLSVKD